ncbi:MAG: TolC family protein [Opitutae bacterium]|nr:TolC family protein [Opitutae bacterium]
MFTFRRILASVFLLGSSVALWAQTSPAAAPEPAGAEHITLQDAIQRALAKNYTIKSHAFDVSVARARVTEQFGIFDPKLTGSYNYSDSELPQLVDPATGVRPAASISRDDSYSLGLNGLLPWGLNYTLSADSGNTRGTSNSFADNYNSFAGVSGRQPLLRDFGFGATTAQIRIALTNRNISEWSFRQSVIDTLTRVIFAYYDLDYAYAQHRSVLRSRDSTAALVAENEKRNKVGQMSEFDVTQARGRLALREEGVLFTERQIRDAENELKALISDDRTTKLLDWRIQVDSQPVPPVVMVNAALDFLEALKKRPDYQQAQLALKRGDINYRYQRNQLLPRVDLVGSYGYSGYDTSRQVSRDLVRHEDYRSYSYGMQVTVPLTFTAERGRYRAAKYQLRQAETDLQRLEQDIVVRVGNSAGQIETSRKRVEATRAARELGQQTLDAEVKRLRAGTGSTFFVLQQQELLSSLEISEARALADYNKAIAEYDRQLGTTLEKLNVSLSVPK